MTREDRVAARGDPSMEVDESVKKKIEAKLGSDLQCVVCVRGMCVRRVHPPHRFLVE